jgi:hypothetical protein
MSSRAKSPLKPWALGLLFLQVLALAAALHTLLGGALILFWSWLGVSATLSFLANWLHSKRQSGFSALIICICIIQLLIA